MVFKGLSRLQDLCLFGLLCLSLCSCISRIGGYDNEVASLKSRIMQIESKLDNKSNPANDSQDLDRKNILAISSSLEQINVAIQRINGDLDYIKTAIKVGAEGESTDAFDSNQYIGQIVAGLNQRVTTLEASYSELVAGLKSQISDSSTQSSRKALSSVSEIQKAYNQKKYTIIIEDAPDLYKKAKTKKEKADILYYQAESLFKKGQLNESALKFNDLIELNQRVPTAKLRLGDVFYKLGDLSTAKLYYQDILENHSKSSEYRSAKEKLDLIGEKTSLRSSKTKSGLKQIKNSQSTLRR